MLNESVTNPARPPPGKRLTTASAPRPPWTPFSGIPKHLPARATSRQPWCRQPTPFIHFPPKKSRHSKFTFHKISIDQSLLFLSCCQLSHICLDMSISELTDLCRPHLFWDVPNLKLKLCRNRGDPESSAQFLDLVALTKSCPRDKQNRPPEKVCYISRVCL